MIPVQITVFYIVLYCFLAGFFAGLLMVFFQTLDVHQPTWTMGASLIGTNPGELSRQTKIALFFKF